jgi:hypothetical protein
VQDKKLDTKTDHEQKAKPLATKSLSEDPQIARITQIQWATDRTMPKWKKLLGGQSIFSSALTLKP